jgi:hypothetical protein
MSHDKNEGQEFGSETTGSNGKDTNPATGSDSAQSNGGQTKPASSKRAAAARENGKHSKGPTTPEGKEKSKQNSRKHGFFARHLLPAGEAGDKLWQGYSDLVAGIWEYYGPVDYMEGLLTEKVITESIRFSRLMDYESKYVGERQAFHMNGVDRILRFQGAINRQLFQAMKELERMQDKRKAKPTLPEDSGQSPDNGDAGPSAADNGQNHGP